MAFIECLSIHTVQLSHAFRQIPVRRLYYQMVMIVHKTICITEKIISLVYLLQHIKKGVAVSVILEYRLPFITPRSHVIYCPVVL